MTIKFADGTHIEIAATAFDDFVKHDLKWAEFVHGRAIGEEARLQRDRKHVACCQRPIRTECSSMPCGRLLSKSQYSYH